MRDSMASFAAFAHSLYAFTESLTAVSVGQLLVVVYLQRSVVVRLIKSTLDKTKCNAIHPYL